MRNVFDYEQAHLIRIAKEAILSLETLDRVQRWLELDDLPVPDSISVNQRGFMLGGITDMVHLRFLDVTERSDYLRITRDYRKALSTSISKWATRYNSQELVTEGTYLLGTGNEPRELQVEVQVNVGIRAGCTLTYKDVTITQPVIVCD